MSVRISLTKTLVWATFLAASWTWCIGMYLPVLLVREYGVWGWVVFAIPNVIGAAAMGWVLRDAEMSRRMAREHEAACKIFSAVTIGFQFFFLIWISQWVKSNQASVGTMIFAGLVGLLLGRNRLAGLNGALVLMGSILIAIAFVSFRWIGVFALPRGKVTPELGGLAAVCLLGFALCPYLDLTFHTAAQNTSRGVRRAAFTAGFGAFFLAMILFTLAYAPWLPGWPMAVPGLLAMCLAVHFALQCGFTAGLHATAAGWKYTAGGAVLALLAAAFPGGETSYRLFMTFYALVFPAYVWIAMVGRRSMTHVAIAIAAAAPFYWEGIFGFRGSANMVWVLAGVGIVLIAPLVPRRFCRHTMEYA